MKDNPLEILYIDIHKDEIISRLILQKASLYIKLTGRWLDEFLSTKEMQHVIDHSIATDKEAFNDIVEEINRCLMNKIAS